MKACPNCGKEEAYIGMLSAYYGVCPVCRMRGPQTERREEAVAAWDALPRRGDYLPEMGRLGDYAEALGKVRGMCAGLAWNVKEMDNIGETLTQERVLRWLDAIARAATPEEGK